MFSKNGSPHPLPLFGASPLVHPCARAARAAVTMTVGPGGSPFVGRAPPGVAWPPSSRLPHLTWRGRATKAHVSARLRTQLLEKLVSIYIYVCMYICVYVCMYLSIYLSINQSNLSIFLCIYVSMYLCMHACMYVCMWIHICV